MSKSLKKFYQEQRQRYQGKERLLHTVAYHAAPVLENVKPAVLLVFSSGKDNLKALWQRYRREMVKEIPLDFYQLRTTSRSVMVLFYRQDAIDAVLKNPHHAVFLGEKGYEPQNDFKKNLSMLRKRFQDGDFHEIGLFLGIPLHDVVGFIQRKDDEPLCWGCWKVYQDQEKARRLFALFEDARLRYLESIRTGTPPAAYLTCFAA